MTIGHKIKEIREAKGWTLEQVANLTNLSRQRIQAIENGTGYPLIPTLIKLSKALDCSVADILNEPLELGLQNGEIPAEPKGPTDYPCANAEKCMFFKKRD